MLTWKDYENQTLRNVVKNHVDTGCRYRSVASAVSGDLVFIVSYFEDDRGSWYFLEIRQGDKTVSYDTALGTAQVAKNSAQEWLDQREELR